MSIKEKIDKIKDKAARLAVKTAAVATLMTGAGAVSSCAGENENTDDNKDKVENVETEKTFVVFRSTHNSYRFATDTDILMENGDKFVTSTLDYNDYFLEPGDTVTYEITG